MRKRKNYLIGIIIMIMIILSTGCTNNKYEQTPKDKRFLNDIETSIKERWGNSNKVELDFEKYKQLVEDEEKRLSQYEDATFSDIRLENIAKDYLQGVKKQKEALNYMMTDFNKYNELWNQGMADRFNQIDILVNEYGIKVDKEILEEMRGNTKAINEENEIGTKVEELASKIKFQEEEALDNWRTYSAIVENDTGINFKYFNIKAKLLDSEDTVIETAYSNADNWQIGEKIKFKFMTDSKFEKIKITKEDIDYQAE